MNRFSSKADDHLLDLIRSGDEEGWSQFVHRYQGRMTAFAKGQVGQFSDAEDLVQESFLAFLKSLERFRGETSLETWLFRILRRRIIDYYRGRGASREISACSPDPERCADPIADQCDPHDSPSRHALRKEGLETESRWLSEALFAVTDRMKDASNLRDLMITEGLFFASLRNRELSERIGVSRQQIALVRHRLLQRLQGVIEEIGGGQDEVMTQDLEHSNLLTTVWKRDRPSCPKRTTLGKSIIGILDPSWQQYVRFHVDTLGCNYCRANRDDLRQEDLSADSRCQRIFQSTVGFVSRPASEQS